MIVFVVFGSDDYDFSLILVAVDNKSPFFAPFINVITDMLRSFTCSFKAVSDYNDAAIICKFEAFCVVYHIIWQVSLSQEI